MGPSKTSLVSLYLPRKSRNWLAPHETNHAIFLVVQSVGGLVVCWVLLSYQWLKSVVYLLLTFTLLTLSLKYDGQTDGHCIHLWMCSDRRHVCQQHLHIKSSTDKRIILLFLLASIFTVYVFFSFFCIFINIFYTFLILTSIIHSILINIQQSWRPSILIVHVGSYNLCVHYGPIYIPMALQEKMFC